MALAARLKLQRKQPRAAVQEANAVNQAKSDFLTTMSHELRTPMNGVLGMAELLADTPLTPEQLVCVLTIQDSGSALLNLINDILELSKVEAGKLELEQVPFEPLVEAEKVIELLYPKASAQGHILCLHVGDGVPRRVLGDPARLRQLLLTAEQCEKVFEAFQQADTATNRKYGGTGLCLTICRRLTERMGGSVQCTSEVKTGSRFQITVAMEELPSSLSLVSLDNTKPSRVAVKLAPRRRRESATRSRGPSR